jgi:hypothetical protein
VAGRAGLQDRRVGCLGGLGGDGDGVGGRGVAAVVMERHGQQRYRVVILDQDGRAVSLYGGAGFIGPIVPVAGSRAISATVPSGPTCAMPPILVFTGAIWSIDPLGRTTVVVETGVLYEVPVMVVNATVPSSPTVSPRSEPWIGTVVVLVLDTGQWAAVEGRRRESPGVRFGASRPGLTAESERDVHSKLAETRPGLP